MLAYLRIAGLVVVLALVAAVLWYRGEAAAARADLDAAQAALSVAEEANKAQTKAIAVLQEQARLADELTAELTEQLQHLAFDNASKAAELAALKEKNPDVRTYLDTPVPDALRRLYDHTAGGRDAH